MEIWQQILFPILILAGLAGIFAILIAVFSKKFAVTKDTKIEEVLSLLANANCGACGYPGCEGFATALVKGEAKLAACGATAVANKSKILQLLGEGGDVVETVVVCACSGGIFCEDKYTYQGYGDCASVELLAGGRKSCPVGCIGMSKCVMSCPVHALKIVNGVAVIDQQKCIQCGVCILDCPKNLMTRIPKTAKYFVRCSYHAKGKDVRINCQTGCIACGLCVKVCEHDAIKMQDNLPEIDYAKCTNCGKCAAKCPAKCIVEV